MEVKKKVESDKNSDEDDELSELHYAKDQSFDQYRQSRHIHNEFKITARLISPARGRCSANSQYFAEYPSTWC